MSHDRRPFRNRRRRRLTTPRPRSRLAGASHAVECSSCHVSERISPDRVRRVHRVPRDPSRPRSFSTTCESCHTENSWQTQTIDHDITEFPLLGSHATLDCVACHVEPAMDVPLEADWMCRLSRRPPPGRVRAGVQRLPYGGLISPSHRSTIRPRRRSRSPRATAVWTASVVTWTSQRRASGHAHRRLSRSGHGVRRVSYRRT